MFSVHTRPEEFKPQQSQVILDFFFEERTQSGKLHDHRDYRRFRKGPFSNVFRPHEKPVFSDLPGWRSFFKKLRFRNGLVWTVGP